MFRFIRIYNERWRITNTRSFFLHVATACLVFGVCCKIVQDGAYENYDATKAALFACLMSLVWIGIFNTVGLFSEEKSYTEDALSKTLPLSVYMIGTFMNQMKLVFVQTLAVTGLFAWFFKYNSEGIVFNKSLLDYAITFFLILLSSAMLGMALGTFVTSINTVLTVIPIALIAQLLLSGCLFELSGLSDYISIFTTAKYGFCALGSIADMNGPDLPLKITEIYPQVMKQANDLFEHSRAYLFDCWKHMILLGVIYYMIAGLSIYININRKK